MIWDPVNAPRYLQSLQNIASSRQSEDLQTKVVLLESQGFLTSGALEEAYRYFDIDPVHGDVLTEDHILGRFNSRYEDCGMEEKYRAREVLRNIAVAKNSSRLQAVATQGMHSSLSPP